MPLFHQEFIVGHPGIFSVILLLHVGVKRSDWIFQITRPFCSNHIALFKHSFTVLLQGATIGLWHWIPAIFQKAFCLEFVAIWP